MKKLILSIFLISIFTILLNASNYTNNEKLANHLSLNFSNILWQYEQEQMKENLKSSLLNYNINAIVIYDKGLKEYHISFKENEKVIYLKSDNLLKKFNNKKYSKVIKKGNIILGELTLYIDNTKSIALTAKERKWLKEKKVLNISADKNYPPYDFVENGKPTGYSTEYVRLLGDKLGIKLNFIINKNWDESVKMFCERKLDILHATDLSKKVNKCGNFSIPQIKDNRLIVTRKNGFENITSSKDLIGYTMVTPKGWSNESIYKKKYGNKIKYIQSKDIEEALEFIRDGRADFTTGSSNVLQYLILKNGYTNLIFHKNDIKQSDKKGENDNLYIASRDDQPLLQSIINKAMGSLSIDEKNILKEQWFEKTIDKKSILTTKEKQYLISQENITLCIDPIWKPIDYIDENGKQSGIGSFFIQDIEKSIDKKLKLISTKTWNETLINIKNGNCDIVSLMQKSKSRSKYLNFTKPYFIKQSVLVTKKNTSYIDNIALLENEKIGVVKGFITYDLLKENFKNLKLIEYDGLYDGFKAVESGEIFGFVDLASTSNYLIQNKGFDIKISGSTNIYMQLALGVKKDDDILLSIMKKALNNIDDATKLKYSNLYSNVTYQKVTDYSLVWNILIISGLLLILFGYRNAKISLAKKQIEKKNKELDKLLLIQSRQATFGTMIDTISHQWKQPLNELGLQMMSIDTQLKLYNKAPSKQSLGITIDKSNHILEFMSTTIDIFRNFFKTSSKISKVNISTTINNTILFLESTFEVDNIKIQKDIEPNIYFYCLEEEFAHSVLNILVNAKDIFKKRDIKDPTIDINLKLLNNKIIITIEDNGDGIKLNPIEKIFKSNVSEKENGGIGLFITNKIIVEKFTGKIIVNNTKNGAKFDIILPAGLE